MNIIIYTLCIFSLAVSQSSFAVTASLVAGPRGAELDPQRNQFAIDVKPTKILGMGRPGSDDLAIDKPDGLAFTADGKLLVVETKNRRVRIYQAPSFEFLGFFGESSFSSLGEPVGIAVSPLTAEVFVADEDANEVIVFNAKFEFQRRLFQSEKNDKLGGITVDFKGRIYTVDAMLREVRRYLPDGSRDPSWKFVPRRSDGSPYLDLCEGIAVDEARSLLYVSSELDRAIQVFDLESGLYRGMAIGAKVETKDARPTGKSIFYQSVEGLSLAYGRYLFAVDEAPGHIHAFDLKSKEAWNADLNAFTKRDGYLGYFGTTAPYDFDADKDLKNQVKRGEIIPGKVNPPGSFCSPDGIAVYTPLNRETGWIAIADQCNYRIAIYSLRELLSALNVSNRP